VVELRHIFLNLSRSSKLISFQLSPLPSRYFTAFC